MRIYNPPHPGEIIRQLCLEPLGLTVTDAASALGVSRKGSRVAADAGRDCAPAALIRRFRAAPQLHR